jgi:hypothetical protein
MIFLFVLPETLEQADPIPCIARAMNRRPKLLLNANAKKKKTNYFSYHLNHQNLYSLRVDKIIITNPENIGIL